MRSDQAVSADDDTDAWALDTSQVRGASLQRQIEVKLRDARNQLQNRQEERRRTALLWRDRLAFMLLWTLIASLLYSAVVITYVASNGGGRTVRTDVTIGGAVGLWMATATLFAIKSLGERNGKLHTGLDVELLIYDQIFELRAERIATEFARDHSAQRQDIAKLTDLVSDLADRLDGNTKALQKLAFHVLNEGDREASRVLDRYNDMMGSDAGRPAVGDGVTPLPRRRS